MPAFWATAEGAQEGLGKLNLDGTDWRIATDPQNVGREQKWAEAPRPEAKATRVPWIIQDAFPGYHGVAWYWKKFTGPKEAGSDGRQLLRFEAVHYRADVWLNGTYLGNHENGETPFEFDVTAALRAQGENLLAVRVLDPINGKPIDGIDRLQVPHRGSGTPQHGGIEGSVDVLSVGPVYIQDIHAVPNWKTGEIALTVQLANPAAAGIELELETSVRQGDSEKPLLSKRQTVTVPGASQSAATTLQVPNHQLWDLDRPTLYRIEVKVTTKRGTARVTDVRNVSIGFRDFRIESGYFTLNGKRIYPRSALTGNHSPLGIWVPPDVGADIDLLGKGLIRAKEMGFNMIRFLGGVPRKNLVELCDRIGLMLYVESMASWHLQDSPQLKERVDRAISEMVRRDRNNPSVVLWGLLNETFAGEPVHHAAVAALPMLRRLDETRLVARSSGRWDRDYTSGSFSNPGSSEWAVYLGFEGPGAKYSEDPSNHHSSMLGHIHRYIGAPLLAEDIAWLRNVGAGANAPIFLGEYGIGSGQDIRTIRQRIEQANATHLAEYQSIVEFESQFNAVWKEWDLNGVFGSPENYFRQTLARMAPRRLLGINAIRANPHLNGHSLTSFADYAFSGEGVIDQWRDYKPGVKEAFQDGWAPLRFCTFVEPWNVYRGATVLAEVVLANEDILRPGKYPVRLSIKNEQGVEVWTEQTYVEVPEGQPALALPFYRREIPAAWPAGRYRLTASFADGRKVAGVAAEFGVWEKTAWPRDRAPISVFGDDPVLKQWLNDNQISWVRFTPGQETPLVVVSGTLDQGLGQRNQREAGIVMRGAAGRGATVVVLDSRFFGSLQNWLGGLPVDRLKGQLETIRTGGPTGGLYTDDAFYRDHPVFAGFPEKGMFDDVTFRTVVRSDVWVNHTPPTRLIAGVINTSLKGYGRDFRSGLLLGEYRQGHGTVVVNTLTIVPNLPGDPVADRLLKNMLGHYGFEAGRNK